ncbi:hypothetical protein ACRB68_58050 [Actinomadura sp. RB68]|uniref:Uncharacterized protein n=1 Tax=Actinomadura macrotermitis TaxID=2585200 RepID=A0A7K0C2Q4_9ACTN|nr:hypothetical protein [Actinomadura macrotermitis]
MPLGGGRVGWKSSAAACPLRVGRRRPLRRKLGFPVVCLVGARCSGSASLTAGLQTRSEEVVEAGQSAERRLMGAGPGKSSAAACVVWLLRWRTFALVVAGRLRVAGGEMSGVASSTAETSTAQRGVVGAGAGPPGAAWWGEPWWRAGPGGSAPLLATWRGWSAGVRSGSGSAYPRVPGWLAGVYWAWSSQALCRWRRWRAGHGWACAVARCCLLGPGVYVRRGWLVAGGGGGGVRRCGPVRCCRACRVWRVRVSVGTGGAEPSQGL